MRFHISFALASVSLLSLPFHTISRAVPTDPDAGCVGERCLVKLDNTNVLADNHVPLLDPGHLHAWGPQSFSTKGLLVNSKDVRAVVPKPKTGDDPDPSAPKTPGSGDPSSPEQPDPGADPISIPAPGSPKEPTPVTQDPSGPIQIPTAGAPKAPDVTPDDPSGPIQIPTAAAPKDPKPTPDDPSGPISVPPSGKGRDSTPPCPKTRRGLEARSECLNDPDNAGSDQDIASDPVDLAANVGGKARADIDDWYDVVDATPKPVFRARDALENKLRSPQPDSAPGDPVPFYKPFRSNDKSDIFSEGRTVDQSIQEMLRELGLDSEISVAGRQSTVTFLDTIMKNDAQVNSFTDDGKLIAVELSESRKNGEHVGLKWNDLLFQQWKPYVDSKGVGAQGLQHIARSNIISQSTIATIDTAFTRTKKDKDSIATFHAGSTDKAEQDAFEALSRSDNGNGILWFLSDFSQALGGKDVVAIHAKQEPDNAHLIFELGKSGS